MSDNVNSCIKCSVTNCAWHAQSRDYCTKDRISVGCCSSTSPTSTDCTECASFVMAADAKHMS